jgi:hypothetical protein
VQAAAVTDLPTKVNDAQEFQLLLVAFVYRITESTYLESISYITLRMATTCLLSLDMAQELSSFDRVSVLSESVEYLQRFRGEGCQ